MIISLTLREIALSLKHQDEAVVPELSEEEETRIKATIEKHKEGNTI